MKISVVIPTYNRPDALHRCLNALLDQIGDLSYEIIVVNDGSTVSYDKVIENVQSITSSIPIAFYEQENSGPAKARNYGVEMAEGDYIAFTDDDCAPHPNWLMSFMAHAKEGVVLGGHTINAYRDNLYSEASQVLVHFIYAFFKDN
ncbi:MAG TPA: glycosyl transferase, partial [Bacteroidetes bacterium]|nr:glycosyl transferase [Bacteroidota bacterium]